jgi:hypothetical protein
MLIERQPSELKVKQTRQGLDTGIGHCFGEDQVSRARYGREDDRCPMLGTAGDRHAVGISLEPAPLDPFGSSGPVPCHPGRGLIEIHQPVEIRTAGKGFE